MKVNIHLLTS